MATYNDHWHELDDDQRSVVLAAESAIAVLAGPGSGKTRVLAHRAQHLLDGHPNKRALLLTFTNKAAGEMKSRVREFTSISSDQVQASTFHTFAHQLLRQHGALVGIDQTFTLMDDDEAKELAIEAALDAGVANTKRQWAYARLRGEAPESRLVERFGIAYQSIKSKNNVLDFDDVIVLAAQLLTEQVILTQAYSVRFPHLLVDEFQDTNPVQLQIVAALATKAESVSVFADDDQAIFSFAGAEAESVAQFTSKSKSRVYSLTMNYRSLGSIVDLANRLIDSDPMASGRRMRAFAPGGVVTCRSFPTAEAEGVAITRAIQDDLAAGYEPDEIAVLVRSGWRADRFLDIAHRADFPVANWLGSTFDNRSRRLLRSALCVIQAHLDDRSRQRLCELLGLEATEEADPGALLQAALPLPAAALLLETRRLAWIGASLREVVSAACKACVVANPDYRTDAAAVLTGLDSLLEADPDLTLEHLLAELAFGGIGLAPRIGTGVKVATLHRTKGLQWKVVYMIGLEQGMLPDSRANTQAKIREERRLCFVGISRAREKLTLSSAQIVSGSRKNPSRFLTEVGLV